MTELLKEATPMTVGFDRGIGKDKSCAVFVKKLPDGTVEVIAELRGEAADFVERLLQVERAAKDAEQTLRNLASGDLQGDAQTIAFNAADNLRRLVEGGTTC